MTKIFGVLSISNATGLKYPFTAVVKNLVGLCDEVVVGVDPTYPEDRRVLDGVPKVSIAPFRWHKDSSQSGREIALQMENVCTKAKHWGADWVVVLQADEFLHEKDFDLIRSFCNYYDNSEVDAFSLSRLYFWKDMDTLRKDWEFPLVRIFKPGKFSFLADNTDKAGMFSGRVQPGREMALPINIYHYSRVGNPSDISRRVRNLDTFFHPEENLVKPLELPDYDFLPRSYDNYCIVEAPPLVDGEFEEFWGEHPQVVKEHYLKEYYGL